MEECIHEYSQTLRDSAGSEYATRAWGDPRAEGTLQGWPEFVSVDCRANPTGELLARHPVRDAPADHHAGEIGVRARDGRHH
jgi:hypothetical protein